MQSATELSQFKQELKVYLETLLDRYVLATDRREDLVGFTSSNRYLLDQIAEIAKTNPVEYIEMMQSGRYNSFFRNPYNEKLWRRDQYDECKKSLAGTLYMSQEKAEKLIAKLQQEALRSAGEEKAQDSNNAPGR